MYVATPSETARNAILAMSAAHREQLSEITHYIESFLPILRTAKLVKPYPFFGIANGARYFDNRWPYMILMEIIQEPVDDAPGEIVFHVISAAAVG